MLQGLQRRPHTSWNDETVDILELLLCSDFHSSHAWQPLEPGHMFLKRSLEGKDANTHFQGSSHAGRSRVRANTQPAVTLGSLSNKAASTAGAALQILTSEAHE